MLGELLNGELEKIELIGVKRIEPAELIAAAPAIEIDRVVAEAVKSLEVVLLPIVDSVGLRARPPFWRGGASEYFPTSALASVMWVLNRPMILVMS